MNKLKTIKRFFSKIITKIFKKKETHSSTSIELNTFLNMNKSNYDISVNTDSEKQIIIDFLDKELEKEIMSEKILDFYKKEAESQSKLEPIQNRSEILDL
jgi:hypothetical protein